jgi:hypothetical protein
MCVPLLQTGGKGSTCPPKGKGQAEPFLQGCAECASCTEQDQQQIACDHRWQNQRHGHKRLRQRLARKIKSGKNPCDKEGYWQSDDDGNSGNPE